MVERTATTASEEIARLAELLDVYGPERERWPARERAFAEALIEREPAAQAMLSAQLELVAWLDELPELEPSAQLRRRVAEIPLRHPRGGRAGHWRSVWMPVFASALALMLGAVSGWASVDGAELTASEAQSEWEDVSALALAEHLAEEWE